MHQLASPPKLYTHKGTLTSTQTQESTSDVLKTELLSMSQEFWLYIASTSAESKIFELCLIQENTKSLSVPVLDKKNYINQITLYISVP